MSKRTPFHLDRCSVLPPKVSAGNWIAYFTEIGGKGNGRWPRALVLYMKVYPRRPEVWALDEENDVVCLNRWERVYAPPALKPDVLRGWLRAMAYYPAEAGPIA